MSHAAVVAAAPGLRSRRSAAAEPPAPSREGAVWGQHGVKSAVYKPSSPHVGGLGQGRWVAGAAREGRSGRLGSCMWLGQPGAALWYSASHEGWIPEAVGSYGCSTKAVALAL